MADGLLNWYKGELKKEGKDVSRFTDDQLTYELGRKIEGKYGAQKINEYPAFAKQYKKINNDLRAKRLGRDGFFGPIKEIGAGFGQGVDETQAMIQGGIGAGLKTVGLDSAGDYMMDAAMANLKESQVNAPTIQSYQDVTGIGDAVRYLTGGLGRVLPSAITMVGTGGATGLVGKKVLEKSVVGPALRKALKDNATKSIAKEGLKKETFDQLSPDAQDIVKAYAYGVSQNVGVGTASGTMGIGEVYTSLYPYTQLDPQDKDYLTEGEALSTSWMFGTAIGSLDSILPSMVGKSVQRKFFKGKSPDAVDLAKADNFTKRSILALTAKGMAVEAGTEATQEYLNVVADKFAHDEKSPFDLSQFTDQEIATMIDAGILGSIGGGVFGVAGGKIENWQTDRKVEQVTKELTEKKRDAEKKVKDILEKLAGETDVVPTFTKGDSVFDVAEGKEYEFVSATGEVAKVKDGEETKEVSIRNLTQAVKKQKEQAETTEETTEDVQDVVQSFQDDIPEKKPEEETDTPEEKPPSKPSRKEVLEKFEEARNVQLELENDEGKVITISAPQARVLEIVGDSNYKQEISKEDYDTWVKEFYAPGQPTSKKEMSATYDQAFEARYPKLLKELQETKDTAEQAKKTGTEKKEKDETFSRKDVIADKNLNKAFSTGAKVTLNQRGRLQANSALGLDVDQARQEFEITEIDDQGFVKIKGGGVTLKQGVDPRNFNKFKPPPKPKVTTPAPTPPTPPEPVVEEIDGSELTEIPALEKGEYVVTFEGLAKQKTTKIESTGGTSLADFLYLGVEQTSHLYKATTILTPSNQRIGIEFDGVKFKYSINSDQNKEIVSREANPSNGYWGDDINLSNEQDKVRIIEGQELVIEREGSTTDNIKSATKDWARQKTQFDVENKDNVTLVVLEDTQGGVYVRQLKSTTGEGNKRQLKILDFKSTVRTGTFPSLRDNSHSMSIEDAKELGFVVTRVIGFVGPKIRGGFKDQYETIGELDAWLSTIQKAESAVALTDMSDIKKLEFAKKKLQEFKEGENIEDEETILLLDTFRHSNGEYDKDKAGDPIVDLSIGFFNPTKEEHGRNKLSVILPTLNKDLINHALKAAEKVSKKSDEKQGGIYTPPESTEKLEKRLEQLLKSGVISGDANKLRQFAEDLLKAVYASQAPSFRSSARISLDQSLSEDGGTFGDTLGSFDEEVEVSDSVARIGVEFSDAGNGNGLMVLESANGLTKGDVLLQISDDGETVNLQNTTDGISIATADAMVRLKQFIAKRIGSTVEIQVRAKTDSMEMSSMLPTREVKVLSASDNNGASIPEAFRGHTDNNIPPSEELTNLATEETAELQRLGEVLGKKPAINLSSGVEVNPAAIDFAHLYAIRTARKGDLDSTKNLLSKAIEAIQTSEEGYADSEANRIINELKLVAGELNTSKSVKRAIKVIADDFYANDLVELLEILSESAVGYFKKEGTMHDFFWGVLGNPIIHLNISKFSEENIIAGVGNREGGNVPLHNPINKSIGSADSIPGKKFNGGKVDPLNESEEAAKVLSQENDNGPPITKVFGFSPEEMSEIKERNRGIIDEVLDGYDLGADAALENINEEDFASEEAKKFIVEITKVLDEGMKAAFNEGRRIGVKVAELFQPNEQAITRAQFDPDTNTITIDPRFYLGEKDTSITPYEITGKRNRDVLITAFIHEAWHATLDTPIDIHEKARDEGKTTKYAETYDLIQEVIIELDKSDKEKKYGLLNEDAVTETLNRIWTRPDFAKWANNQKLPGELQKKIDAHTKTSSENILDALHALYIKLLELMKISIVEGNSFDSLIRLSKKMQEVHDTTAETPEISIIDKSAEDIPLGTKRSPFIDPNLTTLDDDAFDAVEIKARKDLEKLEEQFDAFPMKRTDAGFEVDAPLDFKRQMAAAQDAFSAVELEKFRRQIEGEEPWFIASEFRTLADATQDSENMFKLALLGEIVKKRGIQKELLAELEAKIGKDENAKEVFEGQLKKAQEAMESFKKPADAQEISSETPAKFMSDDIRKDTRTHIRLEADGDGYIVTNLEDKPVRLSLEEAKKIVRFKDNPSRVGRIKLKGDGSELTNTEEEGGKFVEYVRVIENGNDFFVKRDDIEAYDRRDTIKQMSDQLTFDFDKSEEQVEKEKKLAPEVVDTPKYTPQQLTAVVAKNISWGSDNDGIDRSIARKISKGTGIPYNRVLNEIYVLNRMHEDTPIRYRTKFMDEAERGYKRYYGRRKFMVDELDPNIEDRSDEIVGKKPVIEQNKRDTIRMEAASINEVSGVIAQAIQVVREKMGIEENITADSILKVLGVKGTRPGRRMQALLKLSGGDETMKTATTGSMRNNENMYQEANERSLQKLDAIINNANKEKTGALELIKQNEEKIEENSEIKPDSSFIFNLAKTGDKLRKEIVKQLENTATALNNNEEYANDPILKAFEKLKGENESADIEQLKRASKISGKYITDLIDKVINSDGDITLEKLYNNISLDIKDDRAVVLAAVLTSKAGIEQIAFRMLARSGNVAQKRTTIEKLVGIYKANEMQLAQIKRIVGSDEYKAILDEPEVVIINEFIARREDIFKRQKQNKELAKRIQGMDALTSVVAQASERKKILLRHNPASYIMDGTEMPVMKKEGDEYVMDKITVRLNNSLKPADYEEFKKALIANRQYLMDPNLVKDQVDENGYALFGSTTYNYVKSMTLKGEALTVFREHEEAVRGLKTWWLKSNPDLWKRFGTEGREIARMLISADVASREAMPRFRAASRKYNRALLTAAREMGYITTNKTFGVSTQEVDINGFVDHVIDPLLKWNEDNPSFGSLTRKEFYAKAYDYAKNLIGDRRPSPEARNALYELLDNYDNMTTMLKQLGEKHGLYVQNDRRKVMNYFTGKMEPVSRAPIRRGYMTVPRKFKSGFVGYLVRKMADNKGWGDRDSELSKAQLTEYVSGNATDEEKNALMDQWIDTRIDEDILEEFIYPYVKNTSPRHLLTNVEGTAISTADMMDAWAKSEGRGAERFKSWIDGLYESLSHKKDRSDYTAFKLKVINAFNGRFFQMHSALELSGKANDNKAYAMAHALMDSRAQDAIIPIEFLEYQTFDEVSTVIQVEQIIGHAIYGRSGEKLNTMIDNLGDSLGGRVSKLREEVRRVGGKMAEGQEPILTQTQKNEIINNIGEEQFDSLIRAVRNFSNFTKAKDQLGKYLTSDGGPTRDEKFAYDALGTMAFLILQQVKSGLTNILSLGDQMVVYKGLNKYSIKATANSASNLMGQFFGGLLENLGVQLKGNEYAEQLMPTFFNTEENSVGFMDYTLNIGARGAKKASKLETFKLDGLRRLRQAMTYSPVSEGRRTAPVGLRTLFLHPFTYLSNLTNHSLAVSAARMVDGMVREVTAFLEANPNLPQDYEVTADDLGLKSGVTGSSKELFEYINNSLEERTLGTITNLSRKYIDRKARGDMRVLTKDQVLAVGTIALHKVAMEGGFASKPSFMMTNAIARAGAPLQAWALAKVDQMKTQMEDQEKGNYQAAAMIRLLATTAFWLVPIGMMFTFGMDEYDEEVLGKASALRPAPLSTAIPIFGPFIEGDPKGNALAMFERLGRAGNIGGVAFDFLANLMADIDPYNHNRGFSLDTRILVMAQILNLKDAVKNIIHSGTFDYQLVQRPLMYTMGMNGYLQTHQAITNLFDIDSDERRVSNMIGNRNKVRAALANLGIERAPMTGGSFRATRFSVQIRRMERAAYANDSEEFRDAYREAVEASAERGDEDPEKSVLQAFKRRNLRSGISKYKLSDDEWRKVQGVFTDEHASSLRHAMSMHEKFVNILESSSAVLPTPIMDSTSTNPVPFVAPISYNEIIRRSLQL